MVWLSAVSLALVMSELGAQNGLTTPLSPALAQVARERTLSISQFGVVLGQAVLISRSGYAITVGEAAFGEDGNPRIQLRAAQGIDMGIPVKVEAYDPATDLALIRVPTQPDNPWHSIELASKLTSSVVLAQLSGGPSRAQIVRTGIAGVIGLGKRYMPLNEIRLEGNGRALAGSPLFAPDGKLCGIVMASLIPESDAGKSKADMAMETTKSLVPGAVGLTGGGARGPAYGPQPSATTFSLDLEVLSRVVDGCLSEGHAVKHPWVGLFFTTAQGGGAMVTEVAAGGPAAEAGLKAGDVITAAGGMPISNHVDLAAYLFGRGVGTKVELSLRRGAMVNVKVAVEPNATTKLARPIKNLAAIADGG